MSTLKLGYNLLTNYPDVARQWHPTRNGDKKPEDFTPGSNQKVWWLCDRNHASEVAISSRTKGHGCAYCAGKKATEDDNLLTNHPDLARQWHPTRNGDKKPKDFTPKSAQKVWWLCDRNHEWEARIYSRTNGRGCPYCAGKRVAVHKDQLRLL
jgi:hypothetical protein